jgi:hypothetical protein
MLSLPTAVRPIVISAVLGAAGARAASAQAPAPVGIASDSTPVASDSAVAPTGPLLSREQSGIRADGGAATTADTGQVRPRAVEYSEGYGKRLEIHRIASYAELPLFAAEFIVGEKLLSDERNTGTAPGGLKTTHTILAGGLGVLFAVNTVTGVWNMVEARHDPAGRTRRTIHGLSMLVADAGFLWTASLANGARHSDAQATRHRNVAIASISVATASTLMMWLWKN